MSRIFAGSRVQPQHNYEQKGEVLATWFLGKGVSRNVWLKPIPLTATNCGSSQTKVHFPRYVLQLYAGRYLMTIVILNLSFSSQLLFGLCVLPFVYCLSFIFTSPVVGYALTVFLLSILSLVSLAAARRI